MSIAAYLIVRFLVFRISLDCAQKPFDLRSLQWLVV